MSQTGWVETQDAMQARPPRRFSWAWVGVLPFFIFAIAFLILPALSLFAGSFQDRAGNFTFDNIIGLAQPFILRSWAACRRLYARR
jgi:putative spermidine/putrescine transport system permease protein